MLCNWNLPLWLVYVRSLSRTDLGALVVLFNSKTSIPLHLWSNVSGIQMVCQVTWLYHLIIGIPVFGIQIVYYNFRLVFALAWWPVLSTLGPRGWRTSSSGSARVRSISTKNSAVGRPMKQSLTYQETAHYGKFVINVSPWIEVHTRSDRRRDRRRS